MDTNANNFMAMERVVVIGAAGAGKTTLARQLAGVMEAPHLELDAIYHQPDWVALDTDALRRQLESLCAQDRWVTCGAYPVVRDLLFARADTIVCLDHNRARQTARVYARSVRRILTRQELWNGNHEPPMALWPFGSPEVVVTRWAWESIPRARFLFDQLEARQPVLEAAIVRLRGWGEIDHFLAEAKASIGQNLLARP